MTRQIIILALLSIISLGAYAEIYVDETINGVTRFSDTPHADSQAVDINRDSNTISNTSLPESNNTNAPSKKPVTSDITQPMQAQEQRKPYIQFRIEKPKDKQTFQNQPSIPVKIYVRPEIQKGDTIQLMLDGAPYGAAASTTDFALTQIDRGTHKLSAKILNDKKLTIKEASPITIFIQRRSVILQPN